MKFQLLPLLLLTAASSALARGEDSSDNDRSPPRRWRNSTSPSPKSQCRQLSHLTHLTTLASDPAALSSATANDPSKAAALQAKASAAAERLATLQSNTTLVESCSAILAEEEMEHTCWKMAHLEKLAKLASNSTALESKGGDKAEEIKTKVAESAEELAKMQGNATLTGFCSVLTTKEDCRRMKRLERWVERGVNGTRLDGDARGKMGRFEGKMADAKAELEVLKGNATLVEACAAFRDEKDGESSDGGSKGSSSDGGLGNVTAGAGVLQPLGAMVVGLATVALFGLLAL